MKVLRGIGMLATCRAEGGQGAIHAIDDAALAWRFKRNSWRSLDRGELPTTRNAALGLPADRKVTVFERPHTQANYLLKEMGFAASASATVTREKGEPAYRRVESVKLSFASVSPVMIHGRSRVCYRACDSAGASVCPAGLTCRANAFSFTATAGNSARKAFRVAAQPSALTVSGAYPGSTSRASAAKAP